MSDSNALPKFVNRHDEITLIRDRLSLIDNKKPLFDFILLASGIPGIGKSSLLNYVRQEIIPPKFKVASIDLDDIQTVPNKASYLFEQLAHHLFVPSLAWQTALINYQQYGAESEDGRHKDVLIDEFTNSFRIALVQQPMTLLIDNSHYLDETTQRILEEILDGVRDLNRLFVILAGRIDLRWSNFELNRRTRTVNLSPLPKPEAAKMAAPGYATLTDIFYDLTKGYPIALTQAHEWAQQKFEASDPDKANKVKQQEADLILELFNQTFVHLILDHITDINIKKQLEQLIPTVSPLRRFDDYLLYKLLPKVNHTMFGQVTSFEVRSYIRQIATHTYLAKWDSGKQAYSIDRNMRQLLTLNLKYHDIEKLKQIHQIAFSWYEQAITEVNIKMASSPQSVVYLIEQLYHCLNLSLLENSADDIKHKTQEKIAEHFAAYAPREKIHFFEEFRKDEDLQLLLGDSYGSLVEFVGKQLDPIHE